MCCVRPTRRSSHVACESRSVPAIGRYKRGRKAQGAMARTRGLLEKTRGSEALAIASTTEHYEAVAHAFQAASKGLGRHRRERSAMNRLKNERAPRLAVNLGAKFKTNRR
jgi:hypothetical protein